MKGWIVYPRYISLHRDNAFGWMNDEAHKYGIELEVLFFEELAPFYSAPGYCLLRNGKEIYEHPDFVILRGYDTALADHLELLGIPVINSSVSSAAAKDKLLTCQLLAKENINIPMTVGGMPEEWKYDMLCELFNSSEFIVKRRDGAKGEDVYLVNSEMEMAEAIKRCSGNCISQEFISESAGKDVRVWVIGSRAVACVMRYSDSSFRSNYCLGGKVAPYELSSDVRNIAEKSTAVLGLEFAGVDLLLGKDGFLVCEVNANAGFRTLSQVGGNDIPSQLFEYISARYGKLKN